jgi:hypothetical protein
MEKKIKPKPQTSSGSKLSTKTKKTVKKTFSLKSSTDKVKLPTDILAAVTAPQAKRVRRTKEELKDVYIDPLEMERKIQEFYSTGVLSESLAEMVQLIAVRLGLARNFYSYSFKTEMQGDAIVKMMTALRRKRFKCNVGYNPFSYFTKVAYHAFQNCIKKNKKDFDTIKRYQEEMYESYICSGLLPSKKNTHVESSDDYTADGHYES